MHTTVGPMTRAPSFEKLTTASPRCRISRIPRAKKNGSLALLAAAAAATVASVGSLRSASAATGQWITDGGGAYSSTANWQGGVVPNATDDIADFNSLNITLASTITLDVPVTLGQLLTLAAFLLAPAYLRPMAWATSGVGLYAIWDYYNARRLQRRLG